MRSTNGRLTCLALCAALAAGVLMSGGAARADEGMWTYDHVPVKLIRERYGFAPTKEWLDHLRLSSVNMYASASFVSPDGLILTNHHVALFSVQRLSTPEHNYVRDGFYAKTLDAELPVPGLSVQVLQSIEDVTDQVNGAVKPGAAAAQAAEQRDAKIAQIEAQCQKSTGLRGEVVRLYGGARFALYRYKQITELKLVFVPELEAAFFGGDYDNFTYPRHDLDMAFFRAYENGKPLKTDNYLKVNPNGSKDGDLVFVSGHPGKTDRLRTLATLEYLRDVEYPDSIEDLQHTQAILTRFGEGGTEQARRARTALYFVANSLKAREGEFGGLTDAALMAKKAAAEKALRDAVQKDPKLAADFGSAWAEAQAAFQWAAQHRKELRYERRMPGGARGLTSTALTILRYPAEMAKPDGDRLEGFHEAELPDTMRRLKSPGPVYKDLEEFMLADSLERIQAALGNDDPYVKAILGSETPQALAKRVIGGTKLEDASYRRQLLEGKGEALKGCQDPLIELARKADPFLRDVEKAHRDHVEAAEEDALTKIAKAQFAVYGEEAYPDATGTLRLAFGKVAGYPFATTLVPPFTTFYGLYDRAYSFGNSGDFTLTKKQEERKGQIALETPLDLVTTDDITGGNSGSPLVDKEGRLVGLVFDGNTQSHPNAFVYDEVQARCVAVDVRGILEALRKYYDAEPLVQEMLAAAK